MTDVLKMKAPPLDGGKDPNDARNDPRFKELVEAGASNADNFGWVNQFVITTEEAEQMSDPDFLSPNLVIRGHITAIVAESNGAKTTIMIHIAGQLSDSGMSVFYVNADTSGGDAKQMVSHAETHDYKLLLPDLAGLSMDQVVNYLYSMNESKNDYSDTVFIFDTLKKMTDVINKSRSKELYKLFRGLSGKGMTIVLLAHTNKYKDADGKPIYEGTGDLRSDVDELIYLIPKKNDDGSMTVSTMPDKVRGKFEPITFEITPDREVSLSGEYVDVSAERERAAKREKDSVVIELVTESINKGGFKQKDIVDYCKEHSIGWRTTTAVLKRYKTGNHSGCNELWTKEKAFERNAWNYHLNSESTPP